MHSIKRLIGVQLERTPPLGVTFAQLLMGAHPVELAIRPKAWISSVDDRLKFHETTVQPFASKVMR